MTEITFWNGHLGSGKSIGMIRKMFMSYYTGAIILCNFHPKPPLKYFYIRVSDLVSEDGQQALLKMLNPNRSYHLFLDEAHQDADSYEFMSPKNKQFAKFISQIRKRNMDFDYSSQWMTGMISRVRTLTDYLIKCKAYRNPFDKNPKTNLIGILYKQWDVVDEEITNKWYLSAKDLLPFYSMYDTMELIDSDTIENEVVT